MPEVPTAPSVALDRPPIMDSIDQRRLDLLTKKLGAASDSKLSNTEIASFLELAHAYGLDPFANEVWLAKGRGRNGGEGRVLLMVGRDGLRKIATRNGLLADGDVIHEHDEFRVHRMPDGTRSVEHSYGHPNERGEIVGAWCEVRGPSIGGRAGSVRGWYVASMSEFKPTNENQLQYSPWGSQASVMILAAAERQALRQATPLSGLVAEGELDRGEEVAAGLSAPERPAELPSDLPMREAVEAVVERARRAGHAGLADVATVAMTLDGQPAEFVGEWVERASAELDALGIGQTAPPDAQVVPDEPPGDDSPEAQALTARADREEAARLRAEANRLMDGSIAAEDAGEEIEATDLADRAQKAHLKAQMLDPGESDQPSFEGLGE